MYNGFSCYQKKEAGNNDKKVSIVLRIDNSEDGIDIDISRKDAVKSGSSFKTQYDSELALSNLSVDQVLEIVTLLENWLKSESYPGMDIDLSDIEGHHSYEEVSSYRRSPKSDETEFTDLKVSVNERVIEFAYWDESAKEWRDVSIPSSEAIDRDSSKDIQNITNLYETLYDFFTIEYPDEIEYFAEENPVSSEKTAVHKIEQIFNRFSEIAIPLQERRGDREPLTIDDEVDVQYLLHSLLKLHFDDVRREPHTERHSSVSPRIDFLVQNETIGIEVKRASSTRQEKSLRTELSEDKEQYRPDTNIDTLLIFVYDPEKSIENKAEFEDSFEQNTSQMTTRVKVTR